MSGFEAVAILLAGLAAGTVNTVVGSGGLITFPVLLTAGLSPLEANITNNIGVLPGAASGTFGYRRELAGQRARALRVGSAALLGGFTGAVLLLALPGSAFAAVVPFLILGAVVLILLQPVLARGVLRSTRTVEDSAAAAGTAQRHRARNAALLWLGVLLTAVYGGYFGSAQGVILLSLLSLLVNDGLQRLNATKNLLALLTNGIAAIVFVVVVPETIDWAAVGLLVIGSAAGGLIGARFGRRLPVPALRALIVVVGLLAAVKVVLW